MKINDRFDKFIKKVLNEDMTSSGSNGVWSGDSNVPSSVYSDPNLYAPGDARVPSLIGSKSKKVKKGKRLSRFIRNKAPVIMRRPLPGLMLKDSVDVKKIKSKFPHEMKIGTEIEKEHPGIPPERTAAQHLNEFPYLKDKHNYYSKLAPMERKLQKQNKKAKLNNVKSK
jgi:hypothetical protein